MQPLQHLLRRGILVSVVVVGGCSSTSPSQALSDAGTGGDGNPSVIQTCEGETGAGILGTWEITGLAGGEAPDGSTTIKVATLFRFCGSATSGRYRYTEDGLHTPGLNCHRVAEDIGSFTYDNATLTLTRESGALTFSGCSDPTLDSKDDYPVPDKRVYPARISGNELTIEDGSVSGGKPGAVYTRR